MPIDLLPEQRIRKMVFRGGGTKGLEHLGAIEELERNDAWSDVREVWGSSAGGIVSMLAGIGMNHKEIAQQMSEIDFKDFMDKDTPFWSEVLGINEADLFGISQLPDKLESIARVTTSKGYGIFKGDAFSDYAKILIASRTGNPNITFRELHEAATNPSSPIYDPRFKDIMLTGSKIAPPPP